MPRIRLAPVLGALVLAGVARGASLTPPNLTSATTLNDPDLLLVWPNASNGPLEAMQWSTFKAQAAAGLGSAFLRPSNNLADVASPTTARGNLGLGTAATANVQTSGNGVGLLNGANSWSATQIFQGGAGTAPINLAPGAAPSSPNNGDLWSTGSGLYGQIGGATTTVIQQGAWTPTLSFGNPGNLAVSYSQQTGYYTKVGYTCIAFFRVTGTMIFSTATGSLVIGGLTPAMDTSGVIQQAGYGGIGNFTDLMGISSTPYLVAASSVALNVQYGISSQVGVSNVPSGTSINITGNFVYKC